MTLSEVRFGWHPDVPDYRDWIIDQHPDASKLFPRPILLGGMPLASKVDLRSYCSPIENQGRLGSCTAQAGVGLVEFLERRALGRHVDGSRLFVYKTTRNLLGWTGDTGAYVRTTLKALAKFGLCPERYWPYVIADFDKEPNAFCYSYASTARALRYFRIDTAGRDGGEILELIKMVLSYRYPVAFGYPVYVWGNEAGEIRMPRAGDRLMGGHAIMAVGFDDGRTIENSGTGALQIRNSWGTGWGQSGYGWLPYEYVKQRLARDFWVITSQDYLND